MTGHFIDIFRSYFKRRYQPMDTYTKMVETDFGSMRLFDSGGMKPVVISVPDGPNVIEHHEQLIQKLSRYFRVVCFEFPGFGFSLPNRKYDYSLEKSAKAILNIMEIMRIEQAILSFSCANGFYAIKAAEMAPDKFSHLFLAQTPSMRVMENWVGHTIPKILTFPIIGEVPNSLVEKKMARRWYNYALPREEDPSPFQQKALQALKRGGCFCLSGLVQGIAKDKNVSLKALNVPATMVWGQRDFTHKHSQCNSITQHLPQAEIVTFDHCGHFPDLEQSNIYAALIKERSKV